MPLLEPFILKIKLSVLLFIASILKWKRDNPVLFNLLSALVINLFYIMLHIYMAQPLLCEAPVSTNIGEAITSNEEPNVTQNEQPTVNQVPDRSEFMRNQGIYLDRESLLRDHPNADPRYIMRYRTAEMVFHYRLALEPIYD